MNDKELADKVVALGIGIRVDGEWYGLRDRPDDSQPMGTKKPKKFVRDWRVVGALMEKCFEVQVCGSDVTNDWAAVAMCLPTGKHWSKVENDSLPRSIVETCVEALQTQEGECLTTENRRLSKRAFAAENALSRGSSEVSTANAREKPAFMAGFERGGDCVDADEAWQQYRCQDNSDWKATQRQDSC